MDARTRHYALLPGLKDDWPVQSVDLDLAAQRVEIRLEHASGRVCGCPRCGLPRRLK